MVQVPNKKKMGGGGINSSHSEATVARVEGVNAKRGQ